MKPEEEKKYFQKLEELAERNLKEKSRKAKERLEKHRQRLKVDPQYLEDFLEKTKIENESEEISEGIREVYRRFGWEEELPDNLIGIVNKTHADAEKRNREVGYVNENEHWVVTHRYPEPLLTDQAYWILRDRPDQFLHNVEGLDMISYEEALEQIRRDKDELQKANPLGLIFLAASKSESTWEATKMFMFLPVGLVYNAIIAPFVPKSTKAKWLMESHNSYCQEHYQRFKDEMKEIFELYEERNL